MQLRAYIKRLIPSSLIKLVNKLMRLSQQTLRMPQQQTNSTNSEQTPEFDPAKPSRPISYPLKTLEELESRSYFTSFHYPFNKAKVNLLLYDDDNGVVTLPNRPRILVCHDMQGGYVDDKWVQGGDNPDAYAIWHWYLIDVFVYFSHSLVTIPPPCWVNAAHRHGVKVLGTFITEWDEGKAICDKLLETKQSARMYAERLSELAFAMGFDGWLINMEVKLDLRQIPNLKEFVNHLTQTMHSSKPGSLIIWYDSITTDGDLRWQDRLNEKNKPFFDLCDGIFTNYSWEEDYPKLSAEVAGDRKFDVYMGIDVFGRNTFGGGQWTTNIALDVIKKNDVSAALFAPGWLYETKQEPNFQTAQNRWWALVEKSWGVLQTYPKVLPFYSNFDQGHGHHFYVNGKQVSASPWCNISCQGFQPLLEYTEDTPLSGIQVSVDFTGASYIGGGNITFRGNLEHKSHFSTRLFKGNLHMGIVPGQIVYSVKSEGKSMLGLSFKFSCNMNGSQSIFLASGESFLPPASQFFKKFDKVITPARLLKPEMVPGWVIVESYIDMRGCTLTKIDAVCYWEYSDLSELTLVTRSHSQDNFIAQTQFYASLGHISMNPTSRDFEFPPSTSWLTEGQHVNWFSDSDGLKTVSLSVLWKLKDELDSLLYRYNIFVSKIGKQTVESSSNMQESKQEFLGVAEVEVFYVSNLTVPADISALRFIIQLCCTDGTSQKLDDSPYFQLDVDGQ